VRQYGDEGVEVQSEEIREGATANQPGQNGGDAATLPCWVCRFGLPSSELLSPCRGCGAVEGVDERSRQATVGHLGDLPHHLCMRVGLGAQAAVFQSLRQRSGLGRGRSRGL
jgi:hypothetical protein